MLECGQLRVGSVRLEVVHVSTSQGSCHGDYHESDNCYSPPSFCDLSHLVQIGVHAMFTLMIILNTFIA